MKTTFKSLLLAATLLPFAAQAQEENMDKPDRGERAQQRTEAMAKELGLNDEQATKLKAMNERYAEEMRTMRPTEEERKAKREKMKDIDTRRNVELKALLTEEQYAKMMELRQQRMDARKEEGGRKHGRRD